MEQMMADIKAILKGYEEMKAGMKVHQERMKAIMKSAAKHHVVPNEEAAVETIGSLKDRFGGRRLAVRRRVRLTRHAVPARRKGHIHKGPTVEKRRWKGPECNNCIRNRDLREQLRLGSKTAFNKALGQTHELEVLTRAVGISIGLRKLSDWTVRRGRPPLKRKKRCPKRSPRKRMMMVVIHLNRLAPYQGIDWEQREQFESNYL
jgi:hypothetical protein